MAGDRKDETVGPPENLQDQLVEQIIANLRKVYDPELNLNVYDLGLIYEVAVNKEYDAQIIFTLTTPNCPAAEIIPMEIEFATRAVECVNKVNVVLTIKDECFFIFRIIAYHFIYSNNAIVFYL